MVICFRMLKLKCQLRGDRSLNINQMIAKTKTSILICKGNYTQFSVIFVTNFQLSDISETIMFFKNFRSLPLLQSTLSIVKHYSLQASFYVLCAHWNSIYFASNFSHPILKFFQFFFNKNKVFQFSNVMSSNVEFANSHAALHFK